MATGKVIIDTSAASKKIESLDKQVKTLQSNIKNQVVVGVDVTIAEAKIKGLKKAIGEITKDIVKQTQQNALGSKDLLHTDENIKKLKNLSNQITILYRDIANNGGTKTQIAQLNKLNASFNGTLSAIKRVGTAQQQQEADAIKFNKNQINRITDEKRAQQELARVEAQRSSQFKKDMQEYQKLSNEYVSLIKKQENAKKNTSSKNALKPSEEMYMYGYPDGTPRKI